MLNERSVQTASTPFNIFKNKENAESMLNESSIQFKFDSTRVIKLSTFICYTFNNAERPVPTRPTFGSTTCRTHVIINLEIF